MALSILKREFLKASYAFRDLKVVNLGDEMKKVSFILIMGVLLFISLCYQVKAREYSENLTITTPYLRITFDMNKGGSIVDLGYDEEGSYSYGENLVIQGEHQGISDGLYWTGSVNGWFSQKYGDQTEAAVKTYKLLENSSSTIRIYFSTITSYMLENDTNWTWIVTIPKNSSIFYINHSMEIINPDFYGAGTFYFRTVPEVINSPVFSQEYDWTDLSGITTNLDGFSIIMEGMNGAEWTQPPWGSQQEILWHYNPHESLSQGAKYTGFSKILLHGDYAKDGDASNDWKYIAKLYGFLCEDNVCDAKEACYSCLQDCGYCTNSINFSNWNPADGAVSGNTAPSVYVNAVNKIDINNSENTEMKINDEIVPSRIYENSNGYVIQYEASDPPGFSWVNGSNYKTDVFIRDKGNFTANTSWQFVYADMTPPGIIILNPQVNETLTQSFFWLNVTTKKNASCKYNLTECPPDVYCQQFGGQPTNPFEYTDGRAHLEMIDLNAYQQRNTQKKYILTVACYDEFNNFDQGTVIFYTYLTNNPPYWVEEPQDQTLEQGTSLSYSVKAADADNDTLSYSIQTPESEEDVLIFTDDNYTSSDFEGRQILAMVGDTLKDGETKTYTIEGNDYEITAVYIDKDEGTAELSINGILTGSLREGEGAVINDKIQIQVNEILSNQRESIIEFYLIEYGKAGIMISAEIYGPYGYRLMLHDFKYRAYAEEDLYIPAGRGLKEYLSEPEDMLRDNWDIAYDGLINNTNQTTGQVLVIVRKNDAATGESAAFQANSDFLEIGELIGSVKPTFTEADLESLKTITLNTRESSTQVNQYLNFGNTTARVVYEPNNEGEVADYLKFDAGSTLFEYELEFADGAVSDIDTDELIDFYDKTINIMGKDYKFAVADVYRDNGIILIFTSETPLDSSVISIDATTGLISFTPASDWYGNLSVEVKASDGIDEISKIITFTVLPKEEENKPTPIKHHGGGGGGTAAASQDWNCSAWSECTNGKQSQNCNNTYSSAKKTNIQSCNVTEKPAENISVPEEQVIDEQKQDSEGTNLKAAAHPNENTESSSSQAGLQDITGAVVGTPETSHQKWVWIFIPIVLVVIAGAVLMITRIRKKT